MEEKNMLCLPHLPKITLMTKLALTFKLTHVSMYDVKMLVCYIPELVMRHEFRFNNKKNE
jgi:hypothetical protein